MVTVVVPALPAVGGVYGVSAAKSLGRCFIAWSLGVHIEVVFVHERRHDRL
jgi:hypothetical protein